MPRGAAGHDDNGHTRGRSARVPSPSLMSPALASRRLLPTCNVVPLNVSAREADVDDRMAHALLTRQAHRMGSARIVSQVRNPDPQMHDCVRGAIFAKSGSCKVSAVRHNGLLLDPTAIGNLRWMRAGKSSGDRVPKVFSCATKHPIADAERAADATVRGSSLGQALEKLCFRDSDVDGAGIAVEVEA